MHTTSFGVLVPVNYICTKRITNGRVFPANSLREAVSFAHFSGGELRLCESLRAIHLGRQIERRQLHPTIS